MPSHDDNNRKSFTGKSEGDYKLLAKLAFQGCRRRYGIHNDRAMDRVRKELQVIHRLGFSAYFLITWDIVRYAQSAAYYHVGRGSGANSIVAFCLYITDVDPLELDLYFERFINPHRTSPPDFDIDFPGVNAMMLRNIFLNDTDENTLHYLPPTIPSKENLSSAN